MTALRVLLILCAASLLQTACVSNTPRTISAKAPLPLDAAVKNLSADLIGQLKSNQSPIKLIGQKSLVVDPFIDAYTAEENETSRTIEKLLMKEVATSFPDFVIAPLSPVTLGNANYVINGTIRLDKNAQPPFYRLSSSVVDLKTSVVIANAEVWLAREKLNHEPVSTYKESPMYLKDKRVEAYIATSLTPAGDNADREYFDSLPTSAILAEADKTFEAGNFSRAAALYQVAEGRADGKTMKTYSALYQCFRKLGQQDQAENAFAKLVDVGLANRNISTRFLFTVKSTDFVADPSLRSQYALWLRQIGKRVASANLCLNIAGHSSRSGSEKFNEQLSQQRAQSVQKLLQKDFPQVMQKTRAIGRGFKDNIIGSGTDDTQDAIDRRVEFRVVDCASL